MRRRNLVKANANQEAEAYAEELKLRERRLKDAKQKRLSRKAKECQHSEK